MQSQVFYILGIKRLEKLECLQINTIFINSSNLFLRSDRQFVLRNARYIEGLFCRKYIENFIKITF